MKRTALLAILITVLIAGEPFAQTTTTVLDKPLAATLEVYAYPQRGQSASTQGRDESVCYQWAVNNTGNDPFALQKQAQAQIAATEQGKQQAAAQAGQGSVAKETVKVAAVGTLIGGISGNEGKGAAYGAAAGLIRGIRRQNAEKAAATQSVEAQGQQMQQATAAQVDSFKKAFSVCLEGKGYLVKY